MSVKLSNDNVYVCRTLRGPHADFFFSSQISAILFKSEEQGMNSVTAYALYASSISCLDESKSTSQAGV